MLSEIFWTFLTTSIIACTLASIRMCYKSKCVTVDLGPLHIVRDTSNEEKVDELTINRDINRTDSTENKI